MKIVHIIGFFQPEFGYKEYYIARNQAKLGHEVFIITSDKYLSYYKDSGNADSTKKIRKGLSIIDGINVYRLPAFLKFRNLVLVKGIKKILKEINPDVVHAYEPVQGVPFFAAYYKKFFQYKLISDHQQFTIPITLLGKMYYYIISRHLSNYMFKKADYVVFPTKSSEEFAKDKLKINNNKIRRIPLGYDEDFFHYDATERNKIRGQYNIKNNEILLISAGRISKSKKYEMILSALSKLNSNCIIKFILIGSGDELYIEDLKNLSKKFKIQDRFMHLNLVTKESLYQYYSAADIGIWPDQPSITIIEALGCNLPVILPDLDTVKHLIEDGLGLLFKQNNVENLKEVLEDLQNNPSKLKKMRDINSQIINSKFSYKEITKKYIKLIS